jgi:hypothetical protein
MPTVTVNGHGTVTGQFDYTAPDGTVITFYGWTFNVTVDGQAGVYTSWIDSKDPADEPSAVEGVINDLEANPGAMEGIAENDPDASDMGEYAGDPGDYGGDYGDGDYGDWGDYGGDDDGGDGAFADGGGEVWGESV